MKQLNSSRINGTVSAPASKSVMIRAVAAAAMSSGASRICNPSYCEDGLIALAIAHALGATISKEKKYVDIIGNGNFRDKALKKSVLDCGESGLCMRLFAPVVGLADGETTLEASGSLIKRPMTMLEELNNLGCICKTAGGFAPVKVKGGLTSGNIAINGSESSQFLTGLLMALPLCAGESHIVVEGLKSKPYIALTIDVMNKFGVNIIHNDDFGEFIIKGSQRYSPCKYNVEGDWSGAAFLLVAGALAGHIKVTGLNYDSYQADKAVLEAIAEAGASIQINDDYIVVERNRLNAFEFNAADCPDLFPPLVALAAGCVGTSIIYGVERLKNKESNRGLALVEEFTALGIPVKISGSRMEITGGNIKGATVDSHNDHRIAMACAVASLISDGDVYINRPMCVTKSYPSFFEDLNAVKVKNE